MILFLDDDPARAGRFRATHPNFRWATTAQECIAELARRPWREVHLDHDLEGIYQDSSSPNCGMEVVRWLETQDLERFRETRFIAHTLNCKAGLRMVATLKRAGYDVCYRPFGTTNDEDGSGQCLPPGE